MKRKAFRKGVTLVEVLVASLLLVITIGPMLMVYAKSKQMSFKNAAEIQANSLLTSELEYYTSVDGATLEDVEFAVNPRIITGRKMYFVEGEQIPYTITLTGKKVTSTTDANLGPNVLGKKGRYYDITGVISWTVSGKNESITLSTFSMYSSAE